MNTSKISINRPSGHQTWTCSLDGTINTNARKCSPKIINKLHSFFFLFRPGFLWSSLFDVMTVYALVSRLDRQRWGACAGTVPGEGFSCEGRWLSRRGPSTKVDNLNLTIHHEKYTTLQHDYATMTTPP